MDLSMSNEDRLARFLDVLAGATNVVVMPHNNPDPDAIASAVALSTLLEEFAHIQCRIAYGGIIGRAENKALVRALGNPLFAIADLHPDEPASVVLVDTQPGSGNTSVPHHAAVLAAIDHHPRRAESAGVGFTDIREYVGATSTILTEYLLSAGIEPDPLLSTALFYGLKTDTSGLTRGASPVDVAAYSYLQSRIDVEAISFVEQAQVPSDYFRDIHNALETARVYGQLIISSLGPMRYPDLTAEIADLLLRLEGTHWVVCMGIYNRTLTISARTRLRQGGAGKLMQSVVGHLGASGGHGAVAGGQIPLNEESNTDGVVSECRRRILRHLGISTQEENGRLLFD